MYILLVFFVWL